MSDPAKKVITVAKMGIHERVPFRLFQMPCCQQLVCWVMPKYPRYCPTCGIGQLSEVLRSHALIVDDNAELKRTQNN